MVGNEYFAIIITAVIILIITIVIRIVKSIMKKLICWKWISVLLVAEIKDNIKTRFIAELKDDMKDKISTSAVSIRERYWLALGRPRCNFSEMWIVHTTRYSVIFQNFPSRVRVGQKNPSSIRVQGTRWTLVRHNRIMHKDRSRCVIVSISGKCFCKKARPI